MMTLKCFYSEFSARGHFNSSLAIHRVLAIEQCRFRLFHHCISRIKKQTANLKGSPNERAFTLKRDIALLHFYETFCSQIYLLIDRYKIRASDSLAVDVQACVW